MDYTVYFADKAVVFTAKTPGEDWYAVTPAPDGGISRAKVTKILESHNCVAVVSADPDAAFRSFAADFTQIEAAGGVVVNDRGEWLRVQGTANFDNTPEAQAAAFQVMPQLADLYNEETGNKLGIVYLDHLSAKLFSMSGTVKDIMSY